MQTAMITGGTSGLGAGFARALAREGHDLVLVARDEERLAQVAHDLEGSYGIEVQTMPADLASRADVQRVAARLEDPEHPIEVFVSNAGFGVHSPLTDPDTGLHQQAIDVMIRAVLVLGGAAARAQAARGHGTIINIGSISGYIRMGSYSAVKAWVNAYGESLAVELRDTGVQVTTVTPGWVRTEFHDRAGISARSIPSALWTNVDTVVTMALRDARRGKVLSVPTKRFVVLGWLCRHLPQATVRWVSGRLSSSRNTHSTPTSSRTARSPIPAGSGKERP